MNHAAFHALFPEDTEIGRDITDEEIAVYCDNGTEVGVWRIDRRTTCGKGEILTPENSHIAAFLPKQSKRERNIASEMTNRTTIILRRGDNPNGFVLDLGEPGVDTLTGEIKFGDGTRAWEDLPVTGMLPDYALEWYRERTPPLSRQG